MSEPAANIESRDQRLREVAAKTPYPYEAFLYVLDSFPRAQVPVLPEDHVDAAELCWRLRDRAIVDFGPAARERLAAWSVRSCDDLGNIVYSMVDSGLMWKSERDSRADFDGVFGFDDAFQPGAKPRSAGSRFQWRLSSMLLLTTLAAIACAGFGKLGAPGAYGAAFAAWIGFVGVYLVIQSIADRSKGWVVSMSIGVFLFALAIALFLSIMLVAQ